ncbi:unnamed protein product, partial [Ectocarpus sp. 13 AM-2016]
AIRSISVTRLRESYSCCHDHNRTERRKTTPRSAPTHWTASMGLRGDSGMYRLA